MAKHPEYDVEMKEIHHTQKMDAPSGTAITLAEQVMEKLNIKRWVNKFRNNEDPDSIISERIDPAPGRIHQISFRYRRYRNHPYRT